MKRLLALFALLMALPVCGCDIFVRPGGDVDVREKRVPVREPVPDRDVDVDVDVKDR